MSQRFSVVTICFNNLEELKATCNSVATQTIPPDEHLVIDGSKNEEIVSWLQTSPQPVWRRWIHERDNGISDAFNKGVTAAKGSVIHLLNSGDLYFDKQAIEIVITRFENDPDLMWVNSRYVQHRGNIDVVSGQPFEKDKLWKGMRTIAHPGMFIKKEVYDRIGLYNTNYRIAMDYDLLVRVRNEKNLFIEKPLVYFAPGGASDQHFRLGLEEVRRSHVNHIGNSIKQSLWQFRQKLLHSFMQTNAGKAWFQRKNKNEKIA